MAPILAKIENQLDYRVAIELTSLEDAYLRIVEKEREKTTGSSFMFDDQQTMANLVQKYGDISGNDYNYLMQI